MLRHKIFAVLLLVLGCMHSEGTVKDTAPTLEIPPTPHSPNAPIADVPADEDASPLKHFTVEEQNGYLFLKFDHKKLPSGTFYIEATYGDFYLGYFVVGDTIALLKPSKGSKVFLYYALDGLGNRLLEEPYTAILP